MEDKVIYTNPSDIEIIDIADYCEDDYDCYETFSLEFDNGDLINVKKMDIYKSVN